MGTQDEPDQPTIAGRALRALRTTRAPDAADQAAPAEPAEPVDLAKPVEENEPAIVEEPVAGGEVVDEPAAEPDLVEESTAAPTTSRRNPLLLAALAVVVAAVAYAIVGAVVYFHGRESSTAKAAITRDDVLKNARIDIATLNTLSYQDPNSGLQQWLNVTTGSFHDSLKQQAATVESAIVKAKMTTTGHVIAAAVADLDSAKNSAIVIASVDTDKTPAGGKSAVDRNRYRATMQLVDGVWKLADLSIVQVGLS